MRHSTAIILIIVLVLAFTPFVIPLAPVFRYPLVGAFVLVIPLWNVAQRLRAYGRELLISGMSFSAIGLVLFDSGWQSAWSASQIGDWNSMYLGILWAFLGEIILLFGVVLSTVGLASHRPVMRPQSSNPSSLL